MRVCHVINNLEVGGAETMLLKLLNRVQNQNIESSVITLIGKGVIGPKIEALGIRVDALGMTSMYRDFRTALRLPGLMRQRQPDVVCTWMYQADLIGGLASRLASSRTPIVWNLRTSLQNGITLSRKTWLIRKACVRLSRHVPTTIVCNSNAVRTAHDRLGYDPKKLHVIPNGFDLEIFQPSTKHRDDVRRELKVPPTTRLIGMMARFNPDKDHVMFLRAAQLIAARWPDVNFVLCGADVTWENPILDEALRGSPYRNRMHLLGCRSDIPRLQASLDIGVLASITWEGFPNAVGEAMSCGVPCVVTDTGGSPEVVGNCGRVVPSGDSVALAEQCSSLLELSPVQLAELGARARQRVQEEYSLDAVTAQYIDLWRELARHPGVIHSKPGRRAA